MVISILLHNFKCIALKLEKINKGERFLCHMTTVCSFARCSSICFPLALETCYDLSSSSKCQGWKEAGFCTHPDHEEALIHWCPKTCYNCKFVYLGFLKRIFNPAWDPTNLDIVVVVVVVVVAHVVTLFLHCCCWWCCFCLSVFLFVCYFVNRLIPDRKCI